VDKEDKLLIRKTHFPSAVTLDQWMIPTTDEIHYHSWKERLKMSTIARFGCKIRKI
jgi:hypothetical protein